MRSSRTSGEHSAHEYEIEPTIAGRVARWAARARVLRAGVESARTSHASVDFCFDVVERDSMIGGGLLAGALAYRLFVFLLPSSLLFVSGLGLYAGTVDESPAKVTRDAGLHGLIASQVAATASGNARWVVFLSMLPVVLYALAKLHRAIAVVYAIVWSGTGRGVRFAPRGAGQLGAAILLVFTTTRIVAWIRGLDPFGGIGVLALYLVVVGGAWLAVSLQLPHRDVGWTELLPGALLVGVGLLFVDVFNVYVTTRLVEERANTYGALGIAAALLLSLVLVGRVIVLSAALNAALADRRGKESARGR